jgi:hypothetical protein
MFIHSSVEKSAVASGPNDPINLELIVSFNRGSWDDGKGWYIEFCSEHRIFYWYYATKEQRDEDYNEIDGIVHKLASLKVPGVVL